MYSSDSSIVRFCAETISLCCAGLVVLKATWRNDVHRIHSLMMSKQEMLVAVMIALSYSTSMVARCACVVV